VALGWPDDGRKTLPYLSKKLRRYSPLSRRCKTGVVCEDTLTEIYGTVLFYSLCEGCTALLKHRRGGTRALCLGECVAVVKPTVTHLLVFVPIVCVCGVESLKAPATEHNVVGWLEDIQEEDTGFSICRYWRTRISTVLWLVHPLANDGGGWIQQLSLLTQVEASSGLPSSILGQKTQGGQKTVTLGGDQVTHPIA
jgi:hypothetical protein